MTILVCVGSSCHVKGSKLVVQRLKFLVEEHQLSDEIDIGGELCMDNCMNGVCVRVEGRLFTLSPNTVDDFFKDEVLSKYSDP